MLKVIKQTVMTTVYGVTRFGARSQIFRQVQDLPNFPESHAWQASFYLADKTFHCLDTMFSATRDIQVCTVFFIFFFFSIIMSLIGVFE